MFGCDKIKDIDLYYYNADRMDIKEYDRIVSAYIRYYHLRANRCKFGFYLWTILKLVLVAVLPVIQAVKLLDEFPWFVTAFSSGIFLIESILELWRFREKWILYRSTCNSLISVQRQFMGKNVEGTNERRREYIEIVEGIIGEEGKTWGEMTKDAKIKDNFSSRK